MTPREQIERLIFIDTEATLKQKELLDVIVNLTEKKLQGKINPVPQELEYIIVEVSIKRYNRIGSEGMRSESVEGHSISFDNNDFREYEDIIDDYLDKEAETSRKTVYFL